MELRPKCRGSEAEVLGLEEDGLGTMIRVKPWGIKDLVISYDFVATHLSKYNCGVPGS